MEKLAEGASISILPRTFQDAIKVCRHLEIRYIWIDSLCIVQDDIYDWERESKLMSEIYSRAACNIAADDNTSSDDGLFRTRPTQTTIPLLYISPDKWKPAAYRRWGRAGIPAGCSFLIEFSQWDDLIDKAPLNQRAWVFQERILAPRVLHFTKDQLLWECGSLIASETYPQGMPFTSMWKSDFKMIGNYLKSRSEAIKLRKPIECSSYCKFCQRWDEFVNKYTRSALTFPDDRALAVAGLATKISDLVEDKYVAGMWLGHLRRQLCWYAVTSPSSENRIPSRRSLPSFSWLSLDGPISFGSSGSYHWSFEIVAADEVRELQVIDDRLVQFGRLKLKAQMRRVRLLPSDDEERMWNISTFRDETPLGDWVLPDYGRENLPVSSEDQEHYLVSIATSYGFEVATDILVERVAPLTYRRIGLVFWAAPGDPADEFSVFYLV